MKETKELEIQTRMVNNKLKLKFQTLLKHLRGTRDRNGVRISFVGVLAEENDKYNIGNPHRQHLQKFLDNQPWQ